METPSYIKALLVNNNKKAQQARKVWSIDLETVWLPFFTASNTMGDTTVPSDALGAPIRLAYNQDGTVKFSKTGRPVTKVAKDLGDNIRLVRDNFTAGLQAYAHGVATENEAGFKAEIAKALEAGQPITTHDNAMLQDAYAKLMAEQVEADLKAKAKKDKESVTPAEKPKAPTKPKAQKAPKAPPTPPTAPPADIQGNGTPESAKERELVTA